MLAMPAFAEHTKADYLFAGAGASTALLLLSMERRGLLKGKSVVVLDPNPEALKHKTFCFWVSDSDILVDRCKNLISNEWNNLRIDRKPAEAMGLLKYRRVSGPDLHKALHALIQHNGIRFETEAVTEISAIENGVLLKTEQATWQAQQVFDSRPPRYLPAGQADVHLLQSFVGVVIVPAAGIPNPDCIDLMDFSVEQDGYTQFMYVLPLHSGELLIELTRFGHSAISEAEAEPVLQAYIHKHFGEAEWVGSEKGCIPMSTAAIDVLDIPGVVYTGGRAGMVKPGTGYAFKNMFFHAESIADAMVSGQVQKSPKSPGRFRFYDRLLLRILSLQPSKGKPIFQTLFAKNETAAVLQFLDEKTRLSQDLRILLRLPFAPFLKALWQDVAARNRGLTASLAVLLASALLWLLLVLAPDAFDKIQYALLALGLLFVGIPHGAIDHLLESGNLNGRPQLGFVIRYLAAAFAYLVFWLLVPDAALLFFLVYSAWHFGETDMQQWKPGNAGYVKKLLWGLLLLGILLLGHAGETNAILENMHTLQLPLDGAVAHKTALILAAVAAIWAIFSRCAAWMLSACMLAVGTQLPLPAAFGLYFLGQHSLNGWFHLRKGLNAGNASLFKKAFPFTAGAFLLLGALLYSMEGGLLTAFQENWLTGFFIFISCISLPHVIAMHRFYEH